MEHLQSLEKRLNEMQRTLAGFIKEAIVESPTGTQCKRAPSGKAVSPRGTQEIFMRE